MRRQRFLMVALVLAVLVLGLLVGLTLAQGPQPPRPLTPEVELGTAFTYQGRLDSGDGPVDGECEFHFTLHNAGELGERVGVTQTEAIIVNEGQFTTQLDFGPDAFNGEARWLGIRVSCPVDSASSDLGRQPLTAAPYAQYSLNAGLLDGYEGSELAFPSGAVMFFDRATCPTGWSELSEATGRVVVGVGSGGTLSGTVGYYLEDLENRSHTHTVNPPITQTTESGSHSHTMGDPDTGTGVNTTSPLGAWVGSDDHWHTIHVTGTHQHSVDIPSFGTSATTVDSIMPYIQLLVCRKD